MRFFALFQRLRHRDRAGNGSAYHGIVAHADQAHHFHVGGNRRRTRELGVAVHTAHGVGQTVRSGTSGHVVRMQGTASAAAGSNGEVLLAILTGPFLIGTGYQVLEAGGVGGVTGDGYVHAFLLHDGYAFQNVVGAIALNSGSFPIGESSLFHNVQLIVEEVIFGLYIGKAIDSGNNISGVFAQAVEDDAQRLFAGTVSGAGDTDRAFCGGEGFMTGQESETFGFVSQQHGAQVAVTQTNFSLFCNRTGDTESFQTDTDRFSGLGGGLYTLFDRNSAAQRVGPGSVFKCDGLYALYNGIGIYALAQAKVASVFEAGKAILGKTLLYFVAKKWARMRRLKI